MATNPRIIGLEELDKLSKFGKVYNYFNNIVDYLDNKGFEKVNLVFSKDNLKEMEDLEKIITSDFNISKKIDLNIGNGYPGDSSERYVLTITKLNNVNTY